MDQHHQRQLDRHGSVCENSGFLSNIWPSNASISTASSRSSSIYSHGSVRTKSIAPPPNRRFSSFFGLGANSNNSTSSSLAFSTASSRSCSGCTTRSAMPHVVLEDIPLVALQADEFAGMDFASLIEIPTSPLNCNPVALKKLQEQSLELIDKLYNSYLDRTRALNEALNKIESFEENMSEKHIRIESLKFQLDGLANEQETLTKAVQDAETEAEKAREETKAALAERNRLAWSSRSLPKSVRKNSQYTFQEEDEDNRRGPASPQRFPVKTTFSSPPQKSSLHQSKYSHSSDSGFESGSDSGSLFSPDYSPFSSKRPSYTTAQHDHTISKFDPSSLSHFTPPASPTKSRNTRDDSITTVILSGTKNSRGSFTCGCVEGPGWDTVKHLRQENGELKTRVIELEDCLGACLEVVSGDKF